MQRKALRRGKNLAFSEDACLEKEKVRSKVTPRKVGMGLKRRRESSRGRLGWRLAWWGSIEKEASHLLGLRGRHQYSDQRSNRNRAPCVAFTAVGTEEGGSNGQIVSVKRATDGRRHRSRKIINDEREKYRAKNGSLLNTSTESKGAAFDKPHKRAYQKGKIESSEQSKEGDQPKSVCGKGRDARQLSRNR